MLIDFNLTKKIKEKAFIQKTLATTGKWLRTRGFTQSWFEMDEKVDEIVNQHTYFQDGVKISDIEAAGKNILAEIFEPFREKWVFHFLWLACWARCRIKDRKNLLLGKDCVVLAYCLHKNKPLEKIPLMCALSEKSALISAQTMHKRGSHLRLA